MIHKFRFTLAVVLGLVCLPMPLQASAELLRFAEYDDEQMEGRRFVEIETDLFRYTNSARCRDGVVVSWVKGWLESDSVDVNYIVTGVFYEEGKDTPSAYTLNGLGRFLEPAVFYDVSNDFGSLLDGQTLRPGDLLCIENFTGDERYPMSLYVSEKNGGKVTVLGNGVEVFGEDFKKVLYYELFDVPPVDLDSYDHYTLYREESPDYGDLNNDDVVNLIDVVTLNKYLMIGKPISYYAKGCADVDKNGIIDETDSLNILKSIIGLVDLDELS